MKKWVLLNRNPGLRLRRSLSPGYHMPPFQGWTWNAGVFYRANEILRYEVLRSVPFCKIHSAAPAKSSTTTAFASLSAAERASSAP